MKNFKFLLSILATGLMIVSCSEEFLDKKPTNFISDEDLAYSAKIKPELVEANLRGIYNQMVTSGIGGTDRQEDFGHKSFDIVSDLLSSDLAQVGSAYNRYVSLANLVWTNDATINIPNFTAWRYYYTIIKSANLVIANSGGNDATPESNELKAVLGQAKALRAYAYFYLSQYYAIEYDANRAILPIYTEPSEPAKAKSKMSEVYDLMISDLNSAISLMANFQRANKASIDQNVAKGLLAYVYASMGESSKNLLAKKLADEVISSGKFTLMDKNEVTGGFTKLTTPGWMWGFDLTVANNLGLSSWHGFMDYYSYSYQAVGNSRGIDKGLYDKINDKDIRKKQFGKPIVNKDKSPGFIPGADPLIPARKFYNLNLKQFGQSVMVDDYVYMRVAEMYLLSAEMAAVEGDEGSAKSRLKELLAKRFDNVSDYAYVDGLSGQALIDEIVFQTKIELIAEGKSYFLMKRRKLSNTRGSNHLNKAGETIPYNDPSLTFSIHEREITNNPFISKQNK